MRRTITEIQPLVRAEVRWSAVSAAESIVTAAFVTGQITADSLKVIAELGFKSIVNNRPDGEAAERPRSDDLAVVAAELGIESFCSVSPGHAVAAERLQLTHAICTSSRDAMREFCVNQLCIVMHGNANGATDVPVTL